MIRKNEMPIYGQLKIAGPEIAWTEVQRFQFVKKRRHIESILLMKNAYITRETYFSTRVTDAVIAFGSIPHMRIILSNFN